MSAPILLVLRLAITFALFSFMGWALYTIWRDLKHQSELLVSRQAPPITLSAAQDTTLHFFTTPEVTIGRDPTCDLALDDKTVSVKHARLVYHHNQWWVEDLESTNGTFLNQEFVSIPTVLADGDQIRCGQVDLAVSIGENASQRPEVIRS